MNKGQAIKLAGGATQLDLKYTHFANINAAKDVWWLDIPMAKLQSDDRIIEMLLFDDRCSELHHLRVPTAYLLANLGHLTFRPLKKCIHLELKVDDPGRFENVVPVTSGIGFSQFVIPST